MSPTIHRTRARLAAVVALGASAMLALSACATDAPAPAPVPTATDGAATATASVDPHAPEQSAINVIQFQMPTAATLIAAQTAGYLDDYGITVSNSWGQSSPAMLSVILGPGGQIGTVSPVSVIDSVNQGLDVVIIGEVFREIPGAQLIVTMPDSGIKGIKDLAGKTVGVTGLNAGSHNRLRFLMLEEGMDPAQTTFVDVALGEVAGALERGEIDAAAAAGPALADMRAKLNVVDVVDLGTGALSAFPSLQWVANGEWAKANPNTVAAFQCAVVIQGAELVTDDNDAYVAAATGPEIGFTAEAIKASPKLIFPAANDPAKLQVVAAMQNAIGLTDTEFDMSSIMVPLPTNC